MHQSFRISRISFRSLGLCALLATSALVAGVAVAADEAPGCCLTEAARTLGFEASEPGSFLELSGESVFRASADLQADGAHWVTVSNPYSDRSITVQLRAIGGETKARSLAVELAPADSASFDLQSAAIHVTATSESTFGLRLENLDSGEVFSPQVSQKRTGRNPRTNIDAAAKSVSTHCQGNWTLTCVSGGCSGLGPYTHTGRVERETIWVGNRPFYIHGVYWNLNTPTGDYTTSNGQGLTATWFPDSGICPDSVTNSLGHTYSVDTP